MKDSDVQIAGLGLFVFLTLAFFFPRERNGVTTPAPADAIVDAAASGQWGGVAESMVLVAILAVPASILAWHVWVER